MTSLVIHDRFCGPPDSANGGYVCGLLASHIEGDAEITLLAPPPLGRRLEVVAGENGVELRQEERVLAKGRRSRVDIAEFPAVGFAEAQEAVRRSSYDGSRHPFPRCFVCGPARAHGDGLRLIPAVVALRGDGPTGTMAAPWVPEADLADADGAVAAEFVWAVLDCPTGFASVGARHLGMSGGETILLGRMSARIEKRPSPGNLCTVVAWPTGRDGRKLFASSTLLDRDGALLAVAQATWLLVN